MKEKVLILASVASMIQQFNMSNIKILNDMGYEVHVACNFKKGSTCSEDKIKQLKIELQNLNVNYFQINFERNIFRVRKNLKAYKEVKLILLENKYKFLHCHSPIGGVIGRIAGHMTQTKVIYTAHGFHFFDGAPKLNWVIYYPIEKFLSRYTDILITINQEDYNRAKNKFYAKKVEYIHGIGIDTEKIKHVLIDRKIKRKELGIPNNAIVLISVGELNINKNHSIIIQAIKEINNRNIYYLICGQGNLEQELKNLSQKLNIEDRVKILGFRKDIYELLKTSDIFVFPSKREGLSVALMEAICCELPVVCSNIRGNNDLITNNVNGFLVENKLNEYIDKIEMILDGKLDKNTMLLENKKLEKKICLENIQNKMKSIYLSI